MATLTPLSLSPKPAAKQLGISSLFQTPTFPKDDQYNLFKDEGPTSSRKKVLFTPKTLEAAKQDSTSWQRSDSTKANTTRNSSSTSSVRTLCRNSTSSSDGDKSNPSLKPISVASVLASTPTTTNKKASNNMKEVEAQMRQKYGKRKCQYNDNEGIEDIKEANESQEKRIYVREISVKKMKLSNPVIPEISTIYLYDSKQQVYRFPVYKEADLKYNVSVQTTLKETDLDNDCDTEHEILVQSLYQAKVDLWKGIQMQKKDEESSQKKVVRQSRVVSSSQGSVRAQEKKNENVSKDEAVSFWAKVSQSFKGLFSPSESKDA